MASNREMPPLPNAAVEDSKKEEAKVSIPKVIKVKALGPGFFKQSRKVIGDVFEVSSMEQVGEWMECIDPVLEKEHKAMMKAKKAKAAGK